MRLLVITDYIVDEQKVFHGKMPKEDNKLLNQLFNRIKTHNVTDLITINGFPIFKVYLEGKHYRVLYTQTEPDTFVLLLFRAKDKLHVKNISKKNKDSIKLITTLMEKVFVDISKKKFKTYYF